MVLAISLFARSCCRLLVGRLSWLFPLLGLVLQGCYLLLLPSIFFPMLSLQSLLLHGGWCKSAKPASKVAFFVGLGPNVGPVEQNTDLVFDKVVTNVGDTYSKQTGRFTAPYNGTYQFTVVVAAQGHQKAAADLMKSGKLVFTVWAESIPNWATSTNTAILELIQGDEVWLMLQKRACFIHGYMYSTFSGYLLFNTAEGE
ncbi:hypothetical protein ACJMK2_022856 [Sinanodonta woodiana]|uniref:C1q domain-containing protein n=1 Tax=Sinanodonta woodiana TaxID=1069815 RepID=A0ABD3TKA8_SINWO